MASREEDITLDDISKAFEDHGLEMPARLAKLLNPDGRKRKSVYRRMYGILKFGAKIGKGKGTFVFPKIIRDFVRANFQGEGEEGASSSQRDAQYDKNVHMVTLAEMAEAKWP